MSQEDIGKLDECFLKMVARGALVCWARRGRSDVRSSAKLKMRCVLITAAARGWLQSDVTHGIFGKAPEKWRAYEIVRKRGCALDARGWTLSAAVDTARASGTDRSRKTTILRHRLGHGSIDGQRSLSVVSKTS